MPERQIIAEHGGECVAGRVRELGLGTTAVENTGQRQRVDQSLHQPVASPLAPADRKTVVGAPRLWSAQADQGIGRNVGSGDQLRIHSPPVIRHGQWNRQAEGSREESVELPVGGELEGAGGAVRGIVVDLVKLSISL